MKIATGIFELIVSLRDGGIYFGGSLIYQTLNKNPEYPKMPTLTRSDKRHQKPILSSTYIDYKSGSPALAFLGTWGSNHSLSTCTCKEERVSSLRIWFMYSNPLVKTTSQGQGVDHGSCLVRNVTSQHLIQGCGIRPFLGQ